MKKKSTTKYAREEWTEEYEDDEYQNYLDELYLEAKLSNKGDQKRHQWQCLHCKEPFKCKPSLNYHRYKGCAGLCLKQYPILVKGERIVVKDGRVMVKGQSGKCKGSMPYVEEDGMFDKLKHLSEVDNLPQMTANIPNAFSKERAESSNSGRSPMHTLGVSEETETANAAGFSMGSENQEHMEVGSEWGLMQADKVEEEEDKKWGWSPVFWLFRDFCICPPDLVRPWKHTVEELKMILEFFKDSKTLRPKYLRPPLIVLVLKATWYFHFGPGCSMIEHFPKLAEKLEHVSQDKEFVDNLLRMKRLLTNDGYISSCAKVLFWTISKYSREEQRTLNADISSFKASSESSEHQEVVKKVLDWCIEIAYHAVKDMVFDNEYTLRERLWKMWLGCNKFNQEEIIQLWHSTCEIREDQETGFTLGSLSKMDKAAFPLKGWRAIVGQIKDRLDASIDGNVSSSADEDSSED